MQTSRDSSRARTLNTEGLGSLPFWRGAQALAALVLIGSLLAEAIARSPAGNILPPPSVGADAFEFDIKVYYLEQSIRKRGALDCLIVGDSMANDGPDPRLVEQAYRAKTGARLHCFNFGMPALTLESSAPLAEALMNRFQPKLLIFMISARDFDPTYGAAFRHVAESDWTRYNLGERSLRGWVVNSWYAYRYFTFGQYWLNPSNRPRYVNARRDISPQGFTPLYGTGERRDLRTTDTLFDPASSDAVQAGMERLLRLSDAPAALLVVDAPIRPDVVKANRENLFGPYTEYMREVLSARGIPFWLTNDLSSAIPAEAWYDFQHVNELGVPALSAWLGNQLAAQYPPEFFR